MKSRTLMSLCQSPRLNPSHAGLTAPAELAFGAAVAIVVLLVICRLLVDNALTSTLKFLHLCASAFSYGRSLNSTDAERSCLDFQRVQRPSTYLNPSSVPVCRAIINSSFVGTTQTDTSLFEVDMRVAFPTLASGSISIPNHEDADTL